MRVEIERKFLVRSDAWRRMADEGMICRQGYLASDDQKTVRVRRIGDRGFLTIKGATSGISRAEFEYEIDAADAGQLLTLCETVVEKIRYQLQHAGVTWEIDVFHGANQGLVLAEVELASEDQPIELSDWVGEEVSDDPRYFNACLARHPFSEW